MTDTPAPTGDTRADGSTGATVTLPPMPTLGETAPAAPAAPAATTPDRAPDPAPVDVAANVAADVAAPPVIRRTTFADVVAADAALRALEPPADVHVPGTPAPPVLALFAIARLRRAIGDAVAAYRQAFAKLQVEFALTDDNGETVPFRQPGNGSIVPGAFLIKDPPRFAQRQGELDAKAAPLDTLPRVSLDDLLDVGRDRVTSDHLTALLPFLADPDAPPSAGALERLDAYTTRMAEIRASGVQPVRPSVPLASAEPAPPLAAVAATSAG